MTRFSLFWTFLGAFFYYAALPPLNIAPLALLVPICWGIAIRQERVGASPPVLDGTHRGACAPRSWVSCSCAVFLAAFAFWLASIWWIACPHPLTSLGLVALSAYLSLYWVLFFVAVRTAVHHVRIPMGAKGTMRIPLLVAMPICWMGTEYLRCHLLGGFSFCALEHAFYLYPGLIQFASIGGSILVGGMIFLCGALIASVFFQRNAEASAHCIIAAILVVAIPVILGYRFIEVHEQFHERTKERLVSQDIVALQGNRQVYLHDTLDEANENFKQFLDLTYEEIERRKNSPHPSPLPEGEGKFDMPDVIIFPETVCPISALAFEGTVKPSDLGWTEEQGREWETEFRLFADKIDTPVILGLSTYVFKDDPYKPERRNSALLVRPDREHSSRLSAAVSMLRYDKMHLVMFGEYIPFAEYLPNSLGFLRTLCPEAHRGTKPVAFPIGQGREEEAGGRQQRAGNRVQRAGNCVPGQIEASVNICFESTVAHLIRSQILTLRKEGHDPRLLINMSNDGWFRNSHQMEQHLATHVFRAVENRMWYVSATNGGYSAVIDPFGNIQSIGKRGAAEAVSGTIWINPDKPHILTPYQRFGDWYALVFAVIVLALAAVHIRAAIGRWSKKGRAGERSQAQERGA